MLTQSILKSRTCSVLVGAVLLVPHVAMAATDVPIIGDAIGGWQMGLGRTENASGLPRTPIIDIIHNVMLWLLALVGIAAVIGFVIAGILYITSAGDEEQAGRAKKAAMWSLWGVIVAISGLVIITAVTKALSGSSAF